MEITQKLRGLPEGIWEVVDSHPDFNGAWGEYETWMIKYRRVDISATGQLLVYLLVGNYYEIGITRNEREAGHHSIFDCMKLLAEILYMGLNPDFAWDVIQGLKEKLLSLYHPIENIE